MEPPPPAGFLAQCYLLYKRQLMCLRRDYTLMVIRVLCHLLIGVIFGYLYMGSGYRANGVLANYAYLYGSLLLIVYTGKMAVTLACKSLHDRTRRANDKMKSIALPKLLLIDGTRFYFQSLWRCKF